MSEKRIIVATTDLRGPMIRVSKFVKILKLKFGTSTFRKSHMEQGVSSAPQSRGFFIVALVVKTPMAFPKCFDI